MRRRTHPGGRHLCASSAARPFITARPPAPAPTARPGRSVQQRQQKPAMDTTLEDARLELARRIYDAALYFETLEEAGLLKTTGHVEAQKVVTWSAVRLELSWK